MVRAIEDGGFDSLWVGEHLHTAGPGSRRRAARGRPWTMLAAIRDGHLAVEFGPLAGLRRLP